MFDPSHLRTPRRDRAILAGLLGAMAATAWLALGLWGSSSARGYLGHEAAGPSPIVTAGLFVFGWLLMIVAMMLPSSIPLVVTFSRLVGRRRRPGRLVG